MRIAIINVTGGGMSEGYRKYLQHVIPRMAEHPEIEAILCASPGLLNVQDRFGAIPSVEFVRCQTFHFLRRKVHDELKRRLRQFRPDVIFLPVGRFLEVEGCPVVNMIQNMEPFVIIAGNSLLEQCRNWLRRIDTKRAAKYSHRIIAPSEYVREFLVRNLDVRSNKIGLVHHGVESAKGDVCRPEVIPNRWENRFLFTAGSIRPARGLEDVIYALEYLADSTITGVVIAGKISSRKYAKRLQQLIKARKLAPKVCWARMLNEQEMSWCYANARAFIMTSRVEAFGIVAVEAMSYGAICVAADNPCLPEIFGDAATLYPPKRSQDLARRIREVLEWSEAKKNEMRQRAVTRASEFGWDECASRTVKELRAAVDGYRRLT